MGLFDDLVIDRRIQCPYCRSSNIDKRAIVSQPNGTHKQLTFCNDCGKSWRIIYSVNKSKVIHIEDIKEKESPHHVI